MIVEPAAAPPATPSSSPVQSPTYPSKGQRHNVANLFPSTTLSPNPYSSRKSIQHHSVTRTSSPTANSTKRFSFRTLPYHATPTVRFTAPLTTHLSTLALFLVAIILSTFRAHLELHALQDNVLAATEVTQYAARSKRAVDARHNVSMVLSQKQAPEVQQSQQPQQQKQDQSDLYLRQSNQTVVELNRDALQVGTADTYFGAHTTNASIPSLQNLAAHVTVAALPDSRKSTFTLHVGLHKTGTSFLQSSLCKNFKFTDHILSKDNLVYLGTCPARKGNFKFPKQFVKHEDNSVMDVPMSWPCVEFLDLVEKTADRTTLSTSPTSAQKNQTQYSFRYFRFTRRIDELRPTGHDVLMVYETFSCWNDAMIQELKKLLEPTYHVKVIVVHRPFHEWLLSYHNFMHQGVPGEDWAGRVLIKANVPFSLDPRNEDALSARLFRAVLRHETHPAELVRRKYAKHFDDVSVLRIRQLRADQTRKGDPLLEHLMCTILKANHTCHEVRAGKIKSLKRNEGSDMGMNLVKEQAVKKGYLQ